MLPTEIIYIFLKRAACSKR